MPSSDVPSSSVSAVKLSTSPDADQHPTAFASAVCPAQHPAEGWTRGEEHLVLPVSQR